jgi:F-type H+-transporting ATPase subunit b
MGTQGPIAEIATTFGVNWPHLMAQTASFSIVCGLLYLLAYRPILRMLDLRRQQIARGIANATEIEAELKRTRTAHDQVLAQASVEAAQIVDRARTAAARAATVEIEKATAGATKILANAQEEAARDRARMQAELKREVGRLVVQTSAAVTGKVLTPQDQRRLFEEAAHQLLAP